MFPDEEIKELLTVSELRKYELFENIVPEGEPCDAIYIILKGSAIVEKETKSHQTKVGFGVLQKGNCFGEAGMLLQESRSATVKANEEVFAFRITEEHLQNLKPETKAKFFRQLATDLSKKLIESSKKIVTF